MVNKENAQQWLDRKYPQDGVCQRKDDTENQEKRRSEINILNIEKGKIGSNIPSREKILVGSLKLEGFANLRTLICSSNELISLDVSDCSSIIELDCKSNKLSNLNVKECYNLRKINCSNNYIKELDLSSCLKLEKVNINNCPELTNVNSNLIYDAEKGKLVRGSVKNISPQIRKTADNDIRNILIVGMTGSGKSTLANALSDTNNFEERNATTSVTKNFQKSDIFQWNEKSYRIIDNIGFGDTNNISADDILFEIGKGIHSAKEGINQILFVFKDRFSESQITAFNLFKDFINETGITRFTTLVRTNFEPFEDPQICQKDCQDLVTQTTQVIKEIVNSCNRVIYVDNPPIPVIKEKDNERIRVKKEDKANEAREKRKKSVKIMLKHLAENCSEIYKLKEWESIYSMVDNYIKRKEKIEKSNSLTKKEELEKERKEVTKGIKVSLGAELPAIGGLTAAIEYSVQKVKHYSKPIHIIQSGSSSFSQLPSSQEISIRGLDSQDMDIENEVATRNKRSLSVSSQTELSREETKFLKKIGEEQEEIQLETMEMEVDNIEKNSQIEVLPKKSHG